MKVINRTHYDTRKLRKIFCEVHNRTAKYEGKLPTWQDLKVEVVYGNYTGDAWLKGEPRPEIEVRIPKNDASCRWLAMLFDHELLHTYGYDHDRMGPIRWLNEGILTNYDWIYKFFDKDLVPVGKRKKEKKKATKLQLQLQRQKKVLKREKEWKKRLEKAEKAWYKAEETLEKIKRQKKYYEKVIKESRENEQRKIQESCKQHDCRSN